MFLSKKKKESRQAEKSVGTPAPVPAPEPSEEEKLKALEAQLEFLHDPKRQNSNSESKESEEEKRKQAESVAAKIRAGRFAPPPETLRSAAALNEAVKKAREGGNTEKKETAENAASAQAIPAGNAAPAQAIPAGNAAPAQAIPAGNAAPAQAIPAGNAAPAKAIPVANAAPAKAIPVANAAPAQAIPVANAAPAQAIPVANAAPAQAIPSNTPFSHVAPAIQPPEAVLQKNRKINDPAVTEKENADSEVTETVNPRNTSETPTAPSTGGRVYGRRMDYRTAVVKGDNDSEKGTNAAAKEESTPEKSESRNAQEPVLKPQPIPIPTSTPGGSATPHSSGPQAVPLPADLKKNNETVTAAPTEGQNSENKIKNPLPTPKKHVPKDMDYDVDPGKNDMHFDVVDMSGIDYFDLD